MLSVCRKQFQYVVVNIPFIVSPGLVTLFVTSYLIFLRANALGNIYHSFKWQIEELVR